MSFNFSWVQGLFRDIVVSAKLFFYGYFYINFWFLEYIQCVLNLL